MVAATARTALVRSGQFTPKSGGHFHPEPLVTLNRNQVVSFSEFSNYKP